MTINTLSTAGIKVENAAREAFKLVQDAFEGEAERLRA